MSTVHDQERQDDFAKKRVIQKMVRSLRKKRRICSGTCMILMNYDADDIIQTRIKIFELLLIVT